MENDGTAGRGNAVRRGMVTAGEASLVGGSLSRPPRVAKRRRGCTAERLLLRATPALLGREAHARARGGVCDPNCTMT